MTSVRATKPKPIGDSSASRADALLGPITKFLVATGARKEELFAAFAKALEEATRQKGRQVHFGTMSKLTSYTDIINAWMRLPEYLNNDGGPRVLPIHGKHSFRELVARIDSSLKTADAIRDLENYGNISRQVGARVKLRSQFLKVKNQKLLAYEPSAKFITDACTSIESTVKLTNRSNRKTQGYWRIAEALNLPASKQKAFLLFSQERSAVFLQEIDEWLRCESLTTGRSKKVIRAGVGLFSISSQ